MALSCETTMQALACPTTGFALPGANFSQEDAAAQSPRSLSKSCEASTETPRSTPRTGVDTDDASENADEQSCHGDGTPSQQDEYYAFLREMAGSFEMADDDEDSNSEDDSEYSSEEENAGEEAPRTACVPPASFMRPGCLAPFGRVVTAPGQAPCTNTTGFTKAARRSCSADSSGSASSRGSERSESGDDDRDCERFPTPRTDNRGPVKDEYSVVQAVFRPQQREDLLSSLKTKTLQAKQLAGPAANPRSSSTIRASYARAQADLLREAQALNAEIAALDQKVLTASSGG